jgi:prolyl-tRNA synthetase
MGCYGIGSSRLMGVIVEKYNDDKGILWPKEISPYSVQIITLAKTESDESFTISKDIYEQLPKNGVEILWDDRLDLSAGEKFADSDLIGVPTRIIVSQRSLQNGGVEIKMRNEKESKVVSLDEVYKMFQ